MPAPIATAHVLADGRLPAASAAAAAYAALRNGEAISRTTIAPGDVEPERGLIGHGDDEPERQRDEEPAAVETERLGDELADGARRGHQRGWQRTTRFRVPRTCHRARRYRRNAVRLSFTARPATSRERSRVEAHRPVIGADVAAGADGGLTAGYDLGAFYDEMFESSGQPRPHYAPLAERLEAMSAAQLEERIRVANAFFLTQGIGFTVYGDDEGTDRIFPFDLVPRIVPRGRMEDDRAGPRATPARPQPLPRRHLPPPADPRGRRRAGRARVRLAQLPPRDDGLRRTRRRLRPRRRRRPRPGRRRSLPACWRTTSALPRASATCSRADRR